MVAGAGEPGAAGLAAGRGGAGILGTNVAAPAEAVGLEGATGRAGMGGGATAGWAGVPKLAGRGCRGPERICPGFGAGGAGLTGIVAPLVIPRGGTSGEPVPNGGRTGFGRGVGAASSAAGS